MITYFKHHEIDKKKWDECIDNAFNGIIYAYSWYLDIVCPTWDALIENDYEKVMPLTHNSKLGISYLYPPLFTQQLGIFSKISLSSPDVEKFIAAIPEKFKYIEIYLNKHNHFSESNFNITKRINYELPLNYPYQEIFNNYNGDTKRNLKLAKKNNIEIIKDADPEQIINIFSGNRGKQIGNIKSQHYKNLSGLIHYLLSTNRAQVWGAKNSGGELCAGAFFIHSHNRYIFIFSGTNDVAKKTGAIRLLIDRFIFEYCQSNSILDFEGSIIPGLAQFYQGFGSKECVYLRVQQNKLPFFLRWIKS